jgi:hypothetical protein
MESLLYVLIWMCTFYTPTQTLRLPPPKNTDTIFVISTPCDPGGMEVVVRAKKGMMEDYEEFQKLWIANLKRAHGCGWGIR